MHSFNRIGGGFGGASHRLGLTPKAGFFIKKIGRWKGGGTDLLRRVRKEMVCEKRKWGSQGKWLRRPPRGFPKKCGFYLPAMGKRGMHTVYISFFAVHCHSGAVGGFPGYEHRGGGDASTLLKKNTQKTDRTKMGEDHKWMQENASSISCILGGLGVTESTNMIFVNGEGNSLIPKNV